MSLRAPLYIAAAALAASFVYLAAWPHLAPLLDALGGAR